MRAGSDGRAAAACLVYDERGERRARYDKIHLFDVKVPDKAEEYRESATIVHGREPVVLDSPVGKLGLAVCYDMRFPELFRRMSAAGAEVFSVPSAFTAPTGRAHWETLLRARAIENLCFLLAPAQAGMHANGRETYGDTMIVDYLGTSARRACRAARASSPPSSIAQRQVDVRRFVSGARASGLRELNRRCP